jgi:hypothetical protein
MDGAEFDRVNGALNKVFFNLENYDHPVYIDLEDVYADALAAELSLNVDDLERTITQATAFTLSWPTGNPYSWHIERFKAWSNSGRHSPPPFTALLCTLSIAAEHMGRDEQFSSNNYYERLFEALLVDDQTWQQKLKFNAKTTSRFWRALNQWLTENDYKYGRPTARQVNKWKHVSYAISQALVRDADRKKFHDMFVQFGLSPFEDLTDAEMILFLNEWMKGTGPSQWLKKIWANNDLRERISSAAIIELQAWDGSGAGRGEGERGPKRLGLAAAVSMFPQRRLEVFMASMEPAKQGSGLLQLVSESSAIARKSFEHCLGGVWLSDVAGDDFAIIEPTSEIELGALMLDSFELEEGKDGTRYEHRARPIVPMLKRETGPYYREVSRTSLLRKHIVLCQAKWHARVNKHLETYALPGFTEYSPDELPGLPPDWYLYENVEMLGVPEEESKDLQPLIPFSEGVTLQLVGGLKLAPNLWHAEARPTVIATAEKEGLILEVRQASFDEQDAIIFSQESDGHTCVLPLDTAEIPTAQALSVTVVQGRSENGETSFSLRSAETPRPRVVGLAHALDPASPRSGISAQSYSEENGIDHDLVLGMFAPDRANFTHLEGISLPSRIEVEAGQSFEEESLAQVYRLNHIEEIGDTCSVRGYHVWICEPFRAQDNKSAPRRMDCKDCGQAVMLKNRGKQKNKEANNTGKSKLAGSSSAVTSAAKANEESFASVDLVLDGLCFLGSGTWRSFQALTASVSSTPWFASELVRNLQDLGHVDLMLNASLARVEFWSIARPVLVLNEHSGFLAGYRNKIFVARVRDALEETGAIFSGEIDGDVVSILKWDNIEEEHARRALAGIHDPHGREIRVSQNTSSYIVSNMAPLAALSDTLSTIHLEHLPDLARFEPRTGKWTACKDHRAEGAYRTTFGGRRYFIRDNEGLCKEGSHEIVKALAASREDVRLHGYDPDKSLFQCAPGCAPPGLMRRALVACSGELPILEDGLLCYRNVSPTIAAILLEHLYGST